MEISSKKGSDFTRLFDLIAYQQKKYPNPRAFNYFLNNRWQPLSIEAFQLKVNNVSCWLLNNDFKKGDKAILVPYIGRPEWMIVDFACQQIGMVVVPIHPYQSDEETKTILEETEAKLCISTSHSLDQLKKVAALAYHSPLVFQIESGSSNYFEALDYKPFQEKLDELEIIKETIAPTDTACIMYTSGSSGEPKGVILSHYNIVCNIKSALTFIPLEPEDVVLSFLPFSHILERTTNYAYIAFGVSIYFSGSRESFTHDFKSVRPIFCTSVPRVLEKMYDYLQQQLLSKNAIKRKTIQWAIDIGRTYKQRERIGFSYALKLFFARLLVLHHWRRMLGGRIKYMVVGAATLRPEIGRLLTAAGIQVAEGYGLTETSPMISINRFDRGLNKFGTVGLVIPGVEIRIETSDNNEDEGEIWVKGPNVTQGYFKKPDLTSEAFTSDGWFKTGDIGKIVHQRFLQITDRKKEIFKTSTGKYIAPQPLQNHLGQSPFIQRCLIIGFQKPFVAALIVPHFEILEAWCKSEHIHWTSPEFMIHNIKVINKFKSEIDLLNTKLPNFKQVKEFILCPKEWSAEEGEITHTLKPVRTVLEKKYSNEIDKIYGKPI
ncbi:MAG: long-chain fatty acid--CoA ligase [Cyclobacteriaceae bacterium]